MTQNIIAENARVAQNQDEYNKKYNSLVNRYNELKKEYDAVSTTIADKSGTSSPYVNRIIKKNDCVVNKTFLRMMEELGYDVELTYVKRTEE